MGISTSIKQAGFVLCAIVSAAAGFVLGSSFFDSDIQPLATYGKRWLFFTICFVAAFTAGLLIDYLFGKFKPHSEPPQDITKSMNYRAVIKRRFQGDRTDEEYRKAENGVIVLAIISCIILMLLSLGVWLIMVIAIGFALLTLADTYLSFKAARHSPRVKIIGSLVSGVFYGVFFGYFMGPS